MNMREIRIIITPDMIRYSPVFEYVLRPRMIFIRNIDFINIAAISSAQKMIRGSPLHFEIKEAASRVRPV